MDLFFMNITDNEENQRILKEFETTEFKIWISYDTDGEPYASSSDRPIDTITGLRNALEECQRKNELRTSNERRAFLYEVRRKSDGRGVFVSKGIIVGLK